MSEGTNDELVEAIDTVSAQEFWWDSPLLSRAAASRDARVVRSLAYRHHCLGNKEAFSAHVVRQTIRVCDGAELPTLWSLIDAETDAAAIKERMDDVAYLPWAATFIIGEVGGAPAFHQTVSRLTSAHSARHFLLIRLFSHILIRYLSIDAETEPQVTLIDLKTGESDRLLSRYISRPNFEMTRRQRAEANELFTPLPRDAVRVGRDRIGLIPEHLFNIPREQFYVALSRLPTRNA